MQRETDECILWPFATTSGGYGSVHVDGKVIGAHVAACIRANGPCPVGLEAAHTCHVPGCFNPRHLRWKTHASNLADRIAAGTAQRGERSPSSKLTAEQVRSIRATYAAGGVSLRLVGLDYGVSTRTIHAIVTGENWAVA